MGYNIRRRNENKISARTIYEERTKGGGGGYNERRKDALKEILKETKSLIRDATEKAERNI